MWKSLFGLSLLNTTFLKKRRGAVSLLARSPSSRPGRAGVSGNGLDYTVNNGAAEKSQRWREQQETEAKIKTGCDFTEQTHNIN